MSKKKNSGSSFLVQGSILAIASIISRIIGLAYRIPMNNTLKSLGGTYYVTAFNIYNIILIISSFSIPTAVSKLVSTYRGKKQKKMIYQVFKGSLIFAVIVGGLSSLLLYFGADFLAGTVYKLPFAAYALRVLAPVLFVVAIVGVIRGFFQGMGTMMPSAISQIIEQIINAIVSVWACWALAKQGEKIGTVLGDTNNYRAAYAAAGGTLGTAMGALAALLFLLFILAMFMPGFKAKMKKEHHYQMESFHYIFYVLIMTILPILLSTTIYNISDTIDQIAFVNLGSLVNMSSDHYAIVWNGYSNEYRLMINVPIAVASALAASSVPAITASFTSGKLELVNRQMNGVIRLSMVVAFPSAVGLAVLARPIFSWIFPSMGDSLDVACFMMYIGAIAVVFYSVSTISNALLQGVDRMNAPVKNAAISLVIHVILLVFMQLVLHWDIYAVVVSNALFSLCVCILNGIDLYKAIGYRQEIVKTFLIPALCSGIMGACTYGIYFVLDHVFHKVSVATLGAMLVAVFVYAVTILLFKGVEESDIMRMPMGGRIVRIAKKCHLL